MMEEVMLDGDKRQEGDQQCQETDVLNMTGINREHKRRITANIRVTSGSK